MDQNYYASQGSTTMLLVDRFPACLPIKDLKSINLILLPRKTSSKLQSMDQGVIRSYIATYGVSSDGTLIEAIFKNKPIFTFYF